MDRRSFVVTGGAAALVIALRRRLVFAKTAKPAAESVLWSWPGARGGLPPYDRVHVDELKPAFVKALELANADIAAIVENPKPATFDNTIVALEKAGGALQRVASVFSTFARTMSTPELRALEGELTAMLAAHDDDVVQNDALYKRVKAVYDARSTLQLQPDQMRLVEWHYSEFSRRGAGLSAKDKARLSAVNQKLATLFTTFSQNLLADEEGQTIVIDRPEELDGLSDHVRASMARAAEEKKLHGKWLVMNTRSSVEPVLRYARDRALREKAWRMWTSRGDRAGDHDNKPVIEQIVALRIERAKLLGYASHAHWAADNTMAKTPETALALMMRIWKTAVVALRDQVAELQTLVRAEGGTFKIAPWDFRYYDEKLRSGKEKFDSEDLRQYLQVDKLREALFWMARQLYGFRFKRAAKTAVYHKDVTAYEVTRDGRHVGYWYFDPWAREGKDSGAWEDTLRRLGTVDGPTSVLVLNACNFAKPKRDAAALISWSDAGTLFHEFGHALTAFASAVRYPSLSFMSSSPEYSEFVAQIHASWLDTRELMTKFCRHHVTGKPIPDVLLDRMHDKRGGVSHLYSIESLASAIFDLRVHMLTKAPTDAAAYEQQLLKELDCPSEAVMRHRPTQFAHIFGGEGYAALYFGYTWADTLTADTAEAFREAGGFYDKPTIKKFHDSLLSVGNSVSPEEAYRRFRGRDVDTAAFMRDRGFTAAK
jgi:peptidyl-dipeptidase Dcp